MQEKDLDIGRMQGNVACLKDSSRMRGWSIMARIGRELPFVEPRSRFRAGHRETDSALIRTFQQLPNVYPGSTYIQQFRI